jgi:predicted N-acetyltransferase YhbS
MGHVAHVRRAVPADIPAIMRMKSALMALDGLNNIPCASEQYWRRDAFGPEPRYSIVVAHKGNAIVGMAIYSQKYISGWVEPVAFLQDLFVEEAHRRQGIALRILQLVAVDARERGMLMIELNVRADNPARGFYSRIGFEHMAQCATYMMCGPTLVQLSELDRNLSVAS